MGASKRVAERLVIAAANATDKPFMVVRFGNVLGSRGSVVPLFKAQIEAGGPICITHPDMKRFFMTIPEAVHLVLQAGGMGRGGELFVLNMGEPLRVVELAEDLVRLSGLNPDDVPIVYTGLRPGEKLEEALWETGATVSETSHPGVLQVTEEPPTDFDAFSRLVDTLSMAARQGNPQTVRTALRACLSTFAEPAASQAPRHH
jgi:FlaA1/EpsC-like NDP-sugar epimerase